MNMANSIPPSELADLLDSGKTINLIDVRTPVEFREVHINVARNIPLQQLDPDLIRQQYSNQPLYIICQKGSRARQACEQLRAAGLVSVVNVEGGTEACIVAGLPMVRGRQTMSLERQVRIAAGSLVLLGVFLACLVHPMFIALSAFIGAGLVFSGIIDTCGMGMLLARMPWNQVKQDTCSKTSVVEDVRGQTP
jgi:rhodanese-related sulfurtransferase